MPDAVCCWRRRPRVRSDAGRGDRACPGRAIAHHRQLRRMVAPREPDRARRTHYPTRRHQSAGGSYAVVTAGLIVVQGTGDIDDLDLKIMAALRDDGRAPTAEL